MKLIDQNARRTHARWWVVLVLLVTFWLSAQSLDWKPLWGDERSSIYNAGGLSGPLTPAQIWNRVADGNPWHVPGFYIALSTWGPVVDWSIPALRVLSLWFGLLTLSLTYRLGVEVAGARVGLFAVVVLGASAFFIHYLTQIRMYAPISFFSVFTVWLYPRLTRPDSRPGPWAWLGFLAGATALLYLHYFAAMLLGAIGLYHLLFVRWSRRWLAVVAALALAAVLFVPWVGALLAGLARAAASPWLQERALGPGEALATLGFLFGNGSGWLAVFALGGATIAVFARRRHSRGGFYLWFVAVAFLAIALVGNALAQVMHEGRLRYIIGLWPVLALLTGFALAQLGRATKMQWLPVAALVVWAGYGVYQVDQRVMSVTLDILPGFYPMHRVARALDGHVDDSDVIVNSITVNELPEIDSPINEYSLIRPFYFPGDVAHVMLQVEDDPAQQRAAQEAALALIDDLPRFWFAYQPNEEAETTGDFEAALNEEYALCRTVVSEPDLRIDLYTSVPLCCENYDRGEPVLARFGAGIGLTGLDTLPVVNGSLPVVASWAVGGAVPAYTYSVAVFAFDDTGNTVSQVDYGLELPVISCLQAALPVDGLPPGQYDLRIAVYAWETGVRLPAVLAATGETGDLARVGSFVLE